MANRDLRVAVSQIIQSLYEPRQDLFYVSDDLQDCQYIVPRDALQRMSYCSPMLQVARMTNSKSMGKI